MGVVRTLPSSQTCCEVGSSKGSGAGLSGVPLRTPAGFLAQWERYVTLSSLRGRPRDTLAIPKVDSSILLAPGTQHVHEKGCPYINWKRSRELLVLADLIIPPWCFSSHTMLCCCFWRCHKAQPHGGRDRDSKAACFMVARKGGWEEKGKGKREGGSVGKVLVPRQGSCNQRSLKQTEIEAMLEMMNNFPFQNTGLI